MSSDGGFEDTSERHVSPQTFEICSLSSCQCSLSFSCYSFNYGHVTVLKLILMYLLLDRITKFLSTLFPIGLTQKSWLHHLRFSSLTKHRNHHTICPCETWACFLGAPTAFTYEREGGSNARTVDRIPIRPLFSTDGGKKQLTKVSLLIRICPQG